MSDRNTCGVMQPHTYGKLASAHGQKAMECFVMLYVDWVGIEEVNVLDHLTRNPQKADLQPDRQETRVKTREMNRKKKGAND